MSKLSNWILWFVFYGTLAAIFSAAMAGDAYAQAAFPAIVTLRSLSLIVIASIMTSAWYQPRNIITGSMHFGCEILIVIGLVATEHNVTAVLTVLTLARYEFARLRVMPRDIPQYG
jgi:hypothetical protein